MTLSTSLKKYIANHTSSNTSDPPHTPNDENTSSNSNTSLFQGYSLSSPKTGSNSSLATDDPLYDSIDEATPPTTANAAAAINASTPSASASNSNSTSIVTPTPISLNQKSLPNDIQRQQRHNSFIKSHPNLSPLNSIPIPKRLSSSPLSRSNNSSNNSNNNINILVSSPTHSKSFSSPTCASPIDIFERNVQSVDLSNSPNTHSTTTMEDNSTVSRSRSHSNQSTNGGTSNSINNSYLMANFRPRHLLSENFTSPALDSTVELISSANFNDTDVVEIPHSRPSQQLFKSYSHVSNSSASDAPSSPRMSFSRKYSNTLTSPSNSNAKLNLENLQTNFAHNRSKSSLSNLSSPLMKSKFYNPCNCIPSSSANGTEINKSITNVDSPILSPKRKSISFYSYSDLLNYERMANANLNRENDLFDAQEEEADIDDLQDAQMLENQSILTEGDILRMKCPKHGSGLQRRATYQGCTEDGDARIDEELTSPNKSFNTGSNSSNPETPIYTVFNPSSSAIDDSEVNNNNNNIEDEDGSIQSWVPGDGEFPADPARRRSSRRQSIVEELASLKSCTTNNSYFEDEFQECTTHESSKIGVPVVNVCSAGDYLNSRTRELRNSFVDTSFNPKKIFN